MNIIQVNIFNKNELQFIDYFLIFDLKINNFIIQPNLKQLTKLWKIQFIRNTQKPKKHIIMKEHEKFNRYVSLYRKIILKTMRVKRKIAKNKVGVPKTFPR